MECELPLYNEDEGVIKEILKSAKKIAIVGLSENPEKDSHRVARYLIEKGYEIFPVNPNRDEILGRRSYKNLMDLDESIDVVVIFRRPEEVYKIVEDAIKINAKAVWMQLGIVNNEATRLAKESGLKVVQSKCIMQEHKRLIN